MKLIIDLTDPQRCMLQRGSVFVSITRADAAALFLELEEETAPPRRAPKGAVASIAQTFSAETVTAPRAKEPTVRRTVVAMVLDVLPAMKKTTSAGLASAIRARFPHANASTVPNSLANLVARRIVKRTGKAGSYRFAMAPGWRKTLAAYEAALLRKRRAHGARVGKTRKVAAKPRKAPSKHTNGAARSAQATA